MLSQSIVSSKRQNFRSKNFLTNCSSTSDTKPTSEDQAEQAKAIVQLNVFDVARPPRLRIQRVPLELAIAPNRFFLSVEVADGRWTLPIQLTVYEVEQLLNQAREAAEGGAE